MPRSNHPSAGTIHASGGNFAPGMADSVDLSACLLSWWQAHGRRDPLQKPWMFNAVGVWPDADQQLNPYGIWIAEVMLQQTQLAVALPYWTRWMAAFPTVEALAAASLDEVRLKWQGLGYYSRARRLHETALLLVGGPWPRSLEEWMTLPGIGRTTAGSILSKCLQSSAADSGWQRQKGAGEIDLYPRPPARDEALFWHWSEALLDPLRPRDTSQALMDLGATLCKPRSPSCERCPWQLHCAAYASGDPCRWPVTDAPKALPFQVIGVGVVLNAAGEVLIDQRLEEGLLGGMWEFPGGKQEQGETIETCIARELKEELGIAVTVGAELITVDHAYSHKKLRFVVHLCDWISGEPQPLASQQVRWVRPDDLSNYAFPAANAKIIEALMKKRVEFEL